MISEFPLCQSGIVFPLMSRVDANIATAALADVFTRRGDPMTIDRDGHEVVFRTGFVTLRVHLIEDRARLRLTRATDNEPMSDTAAKALLGALTATLVRGFAAETVLWLRKDMVLPAASFLAAIDTVRPRRVRSARAGQRLRPVNCGAGLSDAWAEDFDTAQQMALMHLLREAEAAAQVVANRQHTSIALRLTAAVITLFVGLFSLPVGAGLLVWNTLRGGDLRASTSVLTAVAVIALIGRTFGPDLANVMVMSSASLGL